MPDAVFIDVRHAAPRYLVVGLPDTGLVGVISALHLIREFKMVDLAYLDSRMLPPLVVVHGGTPKHPIRIFGDGDVAIVTSEIALPPSLIYPLTDAIFAWARRHGVREIYSLTGLAVPNRLDIEKPSVYGVSNNPELLKPFLEKGVREFREGMLVGVYGVILRDASVNGVDNVVLLSEAHSVYPDPGAAASLLETLNNVLGFNVDIEPLIKQAEEIRVRARDLMRRTAEAMNAMKKGQERDVPMLHYW